MSELAKKQKAHKQFHDYITWTFSLNTSNLSTSTQHFNFFWIAKTHETFPIKLCNASSFYPNENLKLKPSSVI